jgi:hypothetical protein
MLDISDATEDERLKQNRRDEAIKTYRSIHRILEKVTLTNEQIGAINQKMAIVRSRLL